MTQQAIARTLSIVGELASGKRLVLPDSRVIAMREDMTIGFILFHSDGNETIGGWTTLDLRQLNDLLEECGIEIGNLVEACTTYRLLNIVSLYKGVEK